VSEATAQELENEGSLVKIHYVGNAHDEWRRRDDIIHFDSPCNFLGEFCLNNELALGIKASLSGGRRSNPAVKIDMRFDKGVYCRGLKEAGYLKCMKRGIEYQSYKDLNGLFGADWHYCGLNTTGDFCYVMCRVLLVQEKAIGAVHFRRNIDCYVLRKGHDDSNPD